MTMTKTAINTGMDMPQHRRLFEPLPSFAPSFCPYSPFSGHMVSRLGVPPAAGAGKAEIMSDMVDSRLARGRPPSFSSSPSMSSMPSRLAVLPRSRFPASLVALRISSVRLVVLPLASISLTASMSSFGGLFTTPRLSLKPPVGCLMPRPSRASEDCIDLSELGDFCPLFFGVGVFNWGGASSS